jgi:hypothetical protein
MPPAEASTGFHAEHETEYRPEPSARRPCAPLRKDHEPRDGPNPLDARRQSAPRTRGAEVLIKENGEHLDAAEFDRENSDAVSDVVQTRIASGNYVVSNGETSKVGYATCIKDRLSGFPGARPNTAA